MIFFTRQYKQQAAAWEAKFKELVRVRRTEAEQSLEEFKTDADIRIKGQL